MVVITDFIKVSLGRETQVEDVDPKNVAKCSNDSNTTLLDIHVDHIRESGDNLMINSNCLPAFAPSSLTKRRGTTLNRNSSGINSVDSGGETTIAAKRGRPPSRGKTRGRGGKTRGRGRGRPRAAASTDDIDADTDSEDNESGKTFTPVQKVGDIKPGSVDISYSELLKGVFKSPCDVDIIQVDHKGIVCAIGSKSIMENIGLTGLQVGDELCMPTELKGTVEPAAYLKTVLATPTGSRTLWFRAQRTRKIEKQHCLKGSFVNPVALHAAVSELGGFHAVIEGMLWQRVRRKLGLKEQSSSSFLLRKIYEIYFL